MKKPTFRRFLAYIVDVMLVALIAGMFAKLLILNPTRDEYNEKSKEYLDYIVDMAQSSDAAEIQNSEEALNMVYDITYLGVYSSIISLVVSFIYFGIFQYYTNGKTVGKLLFGIKVISTKNEKLKLIQTIIRSAIINSLLTSSIIIICVLFLSKTAFINVNKVIQMIDLGLIIASVSMILYRNDGVGLHDLLASTAVVNNYETYKDYKEVYGKVKEAEYSEVDKKTTKRKNKKEE